MNRLRLASRVAVLAIATLASCANPVLDNYTYPEAHLTLRWTAHGAPVGNAQVDIRGFAPGRCGAPDTADDLRFIKLDAAGRYAGRMPTQPPVTSITRCVTVRFLAPFASGARDTTVIVGDVTFRAPPLDAPLDSINVAVIQP